MSHPDDHKPRNPAQIDTIEDRMGSVHELDFDEERDKRSGRIGDERPASDVDEEFSEQRVAEMGMSGGEALSEGLHEDGVTDDDLSPETLLDESGARDANESGTGGPADQQLREVDAPEIGGGAGLDEAELARRHPLDGKPWSEDEA